MRENRAALTIQLAWRRKERTNGSSHETQIESYGGGREKEKDQRHIFLQYWFRKLLGTLHIHVNNIAKRLRDEWMHELHSAACFIQYIYRRHKGIVSYHILRIARKQAEYEKERQRAAIFIQYVYRKKTGD